jgi:hypothetical protein
MSLLVSILLIAAGASLPAKAISPPPAAAKATVRLPKGSEIPLTLAHGVSAKTARAGDRVILRVAAPIVHQSGVIIAENTLVEGEVASVSPAGRFGRAGGIAIAAKALVFEEGGRLLLEGTLRRDAPRSKANASEGVVTVPFGALSRGASVNLEAGTIFVATTARDF